MNKTFASALTITLAALATCAYAAQNVEPDDVPFKGVAGAPDNGPSRAQVEAELATAKAAGQVSNVEPDDTPFQATGAKPSDPTRAQVEKDLGAAKAAGKVSEAEPNDTPFKGCLLYTSPSPRDKRQSRMPSSA